MTKTYDKEVHLLRTIRKTHRTIGICLALFILILAGTGILLGWKKHSNGVLLPKTQKGSTTELSEWLSIDSLEQLAQNYLVAELENPSSSKIQRIDIRPEYGIVKFIYEDHYWGLQLDGKTGELLSVEKRRSDLIENIHDGSILDIVMGTKGEIIKLIFTSIMGLSLLTFCVTGFWLWYGPKRIRNDRRAK